MDDPGTLGSTGDVPADPAELFVERSELRDRVEELKRREGGAWLTVPVAGLASALVAGGASPGEAVFVGLVTALILSVVIAVFGRSQRRERRDLQRRLEDLEAALPDAPTGLRLRSTREGAGEELAGNGETEREIRQ